MFHDVLAGHDTTFHHDVITKLGTQLDKATLHGGVAAHDINMCTTFLNHQSLLGYNGGMLTHVEQHTHLGELTGQEGLTCGSAKSTIPLYI